MRHSFVCLLVFALAACGGRATLPSAADQALPVRGLSGSVRGDLVSAKVAIHIAVPRGADAKSVAIAVAPEGGGKAKNYYANLTPSSTTVTFSVAAGHSEATFATFGGKLASGMPSGKTLSEHKNVPFFAHSGTKTTIHVAVQGKLAGVALVPTTGELVRTGKLAYAISKCFAKQTASVLGVDANDNYLVGAGAPKPSLVSSATQSIHVGTPPADEVNAFPLSRPKLSKPTTIVTLIAKETPKSGSAKSAAFAMTFNGDICGIFSEFPTPTANSHPAGITVGPDGALWFTESVGGKIGRIVTNATPGSSAQIQEYSTGIPSGSNPWGIVTGPDGTLWFAEFTGNQIGRVTTLGGITEYSQSGGPFLMTGGADGNLWFSEASSARMAKITFPIIAPPPIVMEYSTGISGIPRGVTRGPDGDIWFAEYYVDRIGKITPTGTVTEFSTGIKPGSSPLGIATGPDKALWFTENQVNKIGRITTAGDVKEYPIPTASSYPYGIVAGPDGAMWFAECGGAYAHKIGRITTTGAIKEYETPSYDSQPLFLTVGPDGALWFTEENLNKIGRLQ